MPVERYVNDSFFLFSYVNKYVDNILRSTLLLQIYILNISIFLFNFDCENFGNVEDVLKNLIKKKKKISLITSKKRTKLRPGLGLFMFFCLNFTSVK